jgi:nucleotide-binding universal stress UspA family protein
MTIIEGNPATVDRTVRTGRTVVACDGTPAGWEAVAWAESDCAAGPPGRRLVLCRVYRGSAAGTFLPPVPAIATLELFDPQFTRQIRHVRDRLGSELVDIAIHVGNPVDQLIGEAGPRDLVVVAAPPLGSTVLATTVTAHAPGTVVAVRPTSNRRAGTDWPFSGHVIVGIDHTDRDGGPLRFAFDYAARHRKPVMAVHAAERDPDGVWVDERLMETHLVGSEPGLEALDAALDAVRPDYPDVPVRRAVLRARAGKALVHASSGAALLVVGDRRRPVVACRLLGSVSRHVLVSAHCTVAIVHDRG